MIRLALVVAALAVPASAVALASGGGPSPGVAQQGNGVLAPGGKIRYVAFGAFGGTTVAAIRVHGGAVVRGTSIRGQYGIPIVANDGSPGGLSADGRTLVLATFPTLPGARALTRLAVLSTKSFRFRPVLTLRGAFSYDAISPDGSTLYLIEYLQFNPAANKTVYRVRAFDVPARRLLQGAIVDKREAEQDMLGSPVTRASSRDGGWAYTLYTKPAGNTFVHALDTRHRAAVCVDLPWKDAVGALWNVRMALTTDGSQLVLRQPAIGKLAVIDTRTFRVRVLRKPVAPGSPVP
jgi:hypothetical protein